AGPRPDLRVVAGAHSAPGGVVTASHRPVRADPDHRHLAAGVPPLDVDHGGVDPMAGGGFVPLGLDAGTVDGAYGVGAEERGRDDEEHQQEQAVEHLGAVHVAAQIVPVEAPAAAKTVHTRPETPWLHD